MTRLLCAAVILAVAGTAAADIPPPPAPKGQKYVTVGNELVIDKGVSGYTFVQQVGSGPGRPTLTHTKLDLTPGKPAALPDPGRRGWVRVYAVPQDAARGFKTDAELFEALQANKVKGAHPLGFSNTATVPDSIKGQSVKWTTTVTAIDEKGVKATVEGAGYKPPAKPKGEPNGGEEGSEDVPVGAPAARGGPVVAGIAAALAVALGGLWVAGRARRKA